MKILSKEFKDKVQEEIKVTITDIEKHNINNLPIQHRYHSKLTSLKIKLYETESEFDDTYRELYHYYKNEYDYTLSNKTEIDLYIRTNEKFKIINKKLKLLKLEIEEVESVVELFKNRAWTIKNVISILELER